MVEKEEYNRRTSIISETLSGDHALDTLLSLMREKRESALYTCGKWKAHDYCLVSSDLAVAISVLPEDGPKAAKPGYHPGSTEVYIIFKGSLILESLEDGFLKDECLGQFDVKVILPGKCHRVRNELGREAASFIVKTNPKHEPDVARCNECTYYKSRVECPVYRSWEVEKRLLGVA